jgi:hypothetical protein
MGGGNLFPQGNNEFILWVREKFLPAMQNVAYITFEQIENTLLRANFEYGNTEHFNVSPDLFVKILQEAGIYRRNLEIRQALEREAEERQRIEKEE